MLMLFSTLSDLSNVKLDYWLSADCTYCATNEARRRINVVLQLVQKARM